MAWGSPIDGGSRTGCLWSPSVAFAAYVPGFQKLVFPGPSSLGPGIN